MPNHFHFLIHTTDKSIEIRKYGGLQLTSLTYGIKQLLSSYTKSINKKYDRTGNLFQQKTKSKCVNDSNGNHTKNAFYYIHQNPLKAGLVEKVEDWTYSSYSEIIGIREGFTATSLAEKMIDYNKEHIKLEIYQLLAESAEQSLL